MVTYFNRKDLVDFGHYLVSEKRTDRVEAARDEHLKRGGSPPPLEDLLALVSHADVENWLAEKRGQ